MWVAAAPKLEARFNCDRWRGQILDVRAFKRDDLGTSRVVETSLDALADGEVRLKVSRVGLTANNVTYAVLGEAFDYWEFFPGRRRLGNRAAVGVRRRGRIDRRRG